MQAKNGLKDMQYTLGSQTRELEMNHTLTTWFKGDNPLCPLAEIEITPSQKEHALEAVKFFFYENLCN